MYLGWIRLKGWCSVECSTWNTALSLSRKHARKALIPGSNRWGVGSRSSRLYSQAIQGERNVPRETSEVNVIRGVRNNNAAVIRRLCGIHIFLLHLAGSFGIPATSTTPAYDATPSRPTVQGGDSPGGSRLKGVCSKRNNARGMFEVKHQNQI
jgi:hypothetical protein